MAARGFVAADDPGCRQVGGDFGEPDSEQQARTDSAAVAVGRREDADSDRP